MKVLWSINNILPDIAELFALKHSHAISWVDAMRCELCKDNSCVELVIVCNGDRQIKSLVKKEYKRVIYYIMPNVKNCGDYWKTIISEHNPDIIHIYGTEREHNIPLIENYSKNIPIIISLQGIITEYARHYYGYLPIKDIFINYTFYDIVSRNGIFAKKIAFTNQAKREQQMLHNVKYVEGRSEWDKAISLGINPELKYYSCPRMIRHPFFEYSWDKNNFEKHSLFVHQGSYPIKGLHFMLDALYIVSKKYPDVKLYISGNNILDRKKIKENGYVKYIRKKIKKYGLENRIEFTGYLDANQMADKLSKMNVCIIPSAIENAPNALAEAMIVGTPCIASYVGGNAEMLNNGELGLLYCYYEPQMLAERIDYMFTNRSKAYEFSENARVYARTKHDSSSLKNKLIGIYQKVINDFNISK